MSFYVYETRHEGVNDVEKVKLTREQAGRIEDFKSGSSKVLAVKTHLNDKWKSEINQCLYGLSNEQFIRVLYEPNSYEVEEKIKIGDWAKFHHYGDEWIAVVSEVSHASGYCLPDYDIHVCQNDRFYMVTNPTKSEIKAEKERRVWKSIGREVGEFKHQDILMTDDGPIIVMRPSSVVPYHGEIITVDELYAQRKIEGFYPVESFISFEEGEGE